MLSQLWKIIIIPLLHTHLFSIKMATVESSSVPLQYAKHVVEDMESNVMSMVAVYSMLSRKWNPMKSGL